MYVIVIVNTTERRFTSDSSVSIKLLLVSLLLLLLYLVLNLFPKNKDGVHHQFELTVHSGVQESVRCVANDYIGQTDVPRSSQVCSGGVRRWDVHTLRVHCGRSETGHPRGSTLAHVHSTGRCCSVCIHANI